MKLTEYIAFWEQLTPATLGQLDAVTVDMFHFKDPFNEVKSRAALKALLQRMFTKMKSPQFVVTGKAVEGEIAYLHWIFTAEGWHIEGMSEVIFGTDGRALSHTDHWDAAQNVYEKIPVLGAVLRFIRSRV